MRKRHGRRGAPRSAYRGKSTAKDDPSIPRSMVISKGVLTGSCKRLLLELRKLMAPFTAMSLHQTKSNVLKDFITAAPALHVSHLLVLQQSDRSCKLRIGRLPHGPTLVFEILNYSLMNDVRNRRSTISPKDFSEPPVVVLNGLKPIPDEVNPPPIQIISTLLGHIFPSVDVSTLTADKCRRVVLFTRNKVTKDFELRHYQVVQRPAGLSKKAQYILRKVKDMRSLRLGDHESAIDTLLESNNIKDFPEETQETAAPLKRTSSKQMAIGVQEIGPRLTMQLVRIIDGIEMTCSNLWTSGQDESTKGED